MKRHLKLLLTLLTLICINNAHSQYRVYYDEPVLNGHYLNIGLMDMDLKSLATWNLRYESFLADGKFQVSAEYANITNLKLLKNMLSKYAGDYVEDIDSIDVGVVRSEKLIPKKFEIGGAYNFHRKMSRRNKLIPLYSYYSGMNTHVNVYARRQVKVYRFTGARFGVGHMRTLYYGHSNTNNFDNNNVTVNPQPDDNIDFAFATRFRHTYLYTGISRSSIMNVKVTDLMGAGVRNEYVTYFLDMLLMVNSAIEDVIDYPNLKTYKVNTTDKKKLNRIGWRFGWRTQAVRFFGLGTNFEIGKFTGGTLMPEELTDVLEEEVGFLKYINYMRIGFSLSLTGPVNQQRIHSYW